MIAKAICRGLTTAPVGLVFAREGGAYRLVTSGGALPAEYAPVDLACGADSCTLLFNRALQKADPEGVSSFSLARFRSGAWDAILLDEREEADDRLFVPQAIVAVGSAFVATGIEMSADGKQLARAFRVERDTVTPIDVSTYGRLTAPTADGEIGVTAGIRSTGDVVVLGIGSTATPVVLGEHAAAPRSTLLVAARLGGHVVEGSEVSRQPDPGYDNELRVDGAPLAFPKFGIGASLKGASVRDREVLLYGSQFAQKPGSRNPTAPMFVLVTTNPSLASAEPLANESAAGCSVAKDCASSSWGVKCSGHFACVGGACTKECDFATCGDGKCDVEGGETVASCSDCKP